MPQLPDEFVTEFLAGEYKRFTDMDIIGNEKVAALHEEAGSHDLALIHTLHAHEAVDVLVRLLGRYPEDTLKAMQSVIEARRVPSEDE